MPAPRKQVARSRRAAPPRKAYVKKTVAAKRVYQKHQDGSSSYGRMGLKAAGGALGGLIGGPTGVAIGSTAGNILSDIVGLGDYDVKKNIFMSGRLPKMANIPKAGGTVIRFQEYLGDIYNTADIANPGTFNVQTFLINAANAETFPWLNQIAANYESYSFEGIIFEFRSTSGDALNSTNTALGSVMMATQYDVADAVFASKTEMLNYEFSNSVKPSQNCMHMIECAPGQNVLSELYCLDGAAPPATDSRLYHLGRFCIATVGFQAANVNIGELHITYQVRLLKPKLYATLGNLADFAVVTANVWSNAVPLPVSFNAISSSNNMVITNLGTGTFTLPASAVIKTYRIETFWVGVAAVVITMPILTVANGTVLSSGQVPANATTANSVSHFFSVQTLGNSKALSLSYGGAGTLPTSMSQGFIMRVMQVPQISTS